MPSELLESVDWSGVLTNLLSNVIWLALGIPALIARFLYPWLSRRFKVGFRFKITASLVLIGLLSVALQEPENWWRGALPILFIGLTIALILRPLTAAGVSDAFATTERGIDFASSLKMSKSSIAFLGIGAGKLTSEPEFRKAIQRISAVGGSVRLILSPPDNSILETMAARNNQPPGAYKDAVIASLKRIEQLRNSGFNIEVKFYSASNPIDNQKFRLMIIDKKLCLLGWTVWGDHIGRKNPQIVVRPNSQEPALSMYTVLESHFEDLWNSLPAGDIARMIQP